MLLAGSWKAKIGYSHVLLQYGKTDSIMAGEMAFILEAVEGRRGEGVRERAFRIFWWIVSVGGVGIMLGTICGLWVAGGELGGGWWAVWGCLY